MPMGFSPMESVVPGCMCLRCKALRLLNDMYHDLLNTGKTIDVDDIIFDIMCDAMERIQRAAYYR